MVKLDFPALVQAAWDDAVKRYPSLADKEYSSETARLEALKAWQKYYDELLDLYVVAVQQYFEQKSKS